jgi:hypothetical protein
VRPGLASLSSLPLYSRLAIAIAVGLVIAAAIGEAFGAKTETGFAGAVSVEGEGNAALIALLAISSGGYVELRVEGARSAYYLEIAGSPLTAMNQVTSLGVKVKNQRFLYDFRAGLGYGDAVLEADPVLLSVLPRVSGNVEEAGTVDGVHVISETIEAGQGLAVIVVPDGGVVEYSGRFTVEGYTRLDVASALAVSAALLAAALLPPLARGALVKRFG